METYEDLREYLLNVGFKCIDMNMDGDEIFQMDNFKFSIREEDTTAEIKKEAIKEIKEILREV